MILYIEEPVLSYVWVSLSRSIGSTHRFIFPLDPSVLLILPYCFNHCSFMVYLEVKSYCSFLILSWVSLDCHDSLLFLRIWGYILLNIVTRIYFAVLKHYLFCECPLTSQFTGFSTLPAWGQKGQRPTLILWQWRLCELFSNLEQLPALTKAPPLIVPCPPSSALFLNSKITALISVF